MCVVHLLVKNNGTMCVRCNIKLPSMPSTEIHFSPNQEDLMNCLHAVLARSIRYF
jgi:hypothetical protein